MYGMEYMEMWEVVYIYMRRMDVYYYSPGQQKQIDTLEILKRLFPSVVDILYGKREMGVNKIDGNVSIK